MSKTRRGILFAVLGSSGLAIVTLSECYLRDPTSSFVGAGGFLIHDAGGHTQAELVADTIGFVLAVGSAAFVV